MANLAEQLFDQVLPGLANESGDAGVDWKDLPPDEEELGWPITSPDGVSEEARPFRDEMLTARVVDRLLDGSLPPFRLPQEEKKLIEGAIRARGIDALAFYKSKRFQKLEPFPDKWGIFYLKQGLRQIAAEISITYPGYKDPRRLAHEFLYAHEHFHFRADLQMLMLEAVLKKHLHLPLHLLLQGRRTHFVEEALANRQAYEWSKKTSVGLQEFADDFMSLQPNAYARFKEPYLDLAGEWAANVLDLKPPGCSPRYDLANWVDATPKDMLRRSLCPQYVISPHKLENWLNPAWVPPPVQEIIDGEAVKKLLSSKYANLAAKWEDTKQKLKEDRTLRGLNFKKWPKEGKDVYSVKIDKGFRAHLRHQGQGMWLAYILGPHTKMRHD